MIKNRNTISSVKISKRPVRPCSSGTYNSKKMRMSSQINHIISSLEKNVKDLKVYYNQKDECKRQTISNQKNRTGFRVTKILHRNRSQSNFKKSDPDKNDEKSLADVFEIKNYFLKVHGRQTNNIIELYEFYKKNIQKREKSTRILASIDMSNPNMGLSLEVGKQSLLKQQYLQNHRETSKKQFKQSSKIQEKLQLSNRLESSSKLENMLGTNKISKKNERPSHLATDLISKGLFSLTNVANLMMNKKYKLTKEKEESFRKGKHRQNIVLPNIQNPKQNNLNLINCKFQKTQQQLISQLKQMKQTMNNRNLNHLQPQQCISKQFNEQISFKNQNKKSSSPKPCELEKQSTQQKNKSNIKSQPQAIQKTSENKPFQVSSIKKSGNSIIKIDEISSLQESPIINKVKDFSKSKYYVQPLPAPKRDLKQQKSISLKQDSRIIDLDMLPFDL